MKIKKVGKLLKKLNNLFENIKEEGSISKIEKDLFLAYIKEIYEASIEGGGSKQDNEEEKVSKTPPSEQKEVSLDDIPAEEEKVVQEAVATSEPILDERELRRIKREEERKQREEERRLRSERRRGKTEDPMPATVHAVDDQGFDESSSPETNVVAESSSPETSNNSVSAIVETQVVEAEPEVETPAFSEEMMEIFNETEITEVSDRLSMTPVSDLTKAMGINEKIFTVRELFNKDQERFMTTMSHLNTCVNFEEAKQYLLHGVASENEWDDPSKSKKAINFIKLVQRRYRK